ncbi:MAG: hypothetical protein KGL10_01805, partial [Alphaproteobacteria bacterium]|nr:hypothetical protein [Alphaproteobacteria bacterium]
MANTYPDIAIRPGIATYPFANQGDNSVAAGADADGSEFRRILNMSAPTAVSGTQAATSAAATSSATTSAAASSSTTAPASSSAGHLTFAGFMKDLFDIINPLQHIPVIGALYRHITGDTISPEAEFIGDALYGGPVGGAVAAA